MVSAKKLQVQNRSEPEVQQRLNTTSCLEKPSCNLKSRALEQVVREILLIRDLLIVC